MAEFASVKDIIKHRVKDHDKILNALRIQDSLRRKVGGEESTEIIRKRRDAR